MTAQIVIDDGTNPAAIGSTDNPNSFIGAAHTLSNFDNTGVLGFRWTLLDRPAGSSASLSATLTPTTQITPDVAGSYMVQLETFQDVALLIADGVDQQEVGVRYPPPFDWLLPGAGETIQQDSLIGWKKEVNRFLSEVRNNLMPLPLTVATTGPVTATQGALVLYDPSGGGFTINAPASPNIGDRWAYKNTTLDTTSMTISGNGNNLEDPATSTFLASYAMAVALISIDYIFDGTNWLIV